MPGGVVRWERAFANPSKEIWWLLEIAAGKRFMDVLCRHTEFRMANAIARRIDRFGFVIRFRENARTGITQRGHLPANPPSDRNGESMST